VGSPNEDDLVGFCIEIEEELQQQPVEVNSFKPSKRLSAEERIGSRNQMPATGITEDMIIKSVRHVRTASGQRKYLKSAVAQARADLMNNLPHKGRHYCLIGDYAQNLGLPNLGESQPGETYYWVPYYIYVFGLVNCAHLYPDGETAEDNIGDHMQAHV
jgi:hypothetical protein